jgi:peptide/nickel transport system substrate-binding protein
LSLAQGWEIPEPTHINFHLRPGVTFHDGSPFDSANYQWNMKRLQDPANKGVSLGQLSSIDHVDTPDPQTVSMVMKEPNAAIFFALGAYTASPVSRQAVEKSGDKFKSNPVGTGPFSFVEWVTGSHVTVKKNPNYWMKDVAGKQLPYLDQVTFTAIPDPNTQFANIQAGSVDYTGIGSLNLLDPASNDKNLTVLQGVPGSAVASVVVFNTDKAPLNNVNLRKAIAFALNADAVNKTVYFGKYTTAKDSMIQLGSWAYQDTPGRPTYDLAQAKQFLAAGGQPNGFNFDMVVYNSPTINQQAELYQANLKQIGVNANIVIQDVGPATNNFFQQGQFPMYSTAWGGTDTEPNGSCTLIYQKDAVYNPMKHEVQSGLDDLIGKARQTFDLNQRKDLYGQIAKIIVMDQCFFIPMVLSTPYAAFRKNVGGVEAWPDIGIFRLQFLWNKGS